RTELVVRPFVVSHVRLASRLFLSSPDRTRPVTILPDSIRKSIFAPAPALAHARNRKEEGWSSASLSPPGSLCLQRIYAVRPRHRLAVGAILGIYDFGRAVHPD